MRCNHPESTRRPRGPGAPGAVALGALLAGAMLVSSCQPGMVPGFGAREPALAGAASRGTGHLVVRVREARKLQALADFVAKVTFELSGDNMPGPSIMTVTRGQFTDNRIEVRWDNLLPGPIHLKATLYSSQDVVLASGEGDAEIVAGDTPTALDLAISAETGSTTVAISPADLGEPPANLSFRFRAIPAGYWQAAPPLAIARAGHSAVRLNGSIYVIGGDYNTEIERLDLADTELTWAPRVLPHDQRIVHPLGTAAALGGRIVMVGGDYEYLGRAEIAAPVFFDPETFDALAINPGGGSANLNNLMQSRTLTAVAVDDDPGAAGTDLYMIGGHSRRTSGPLPYVFVTFDLVERLSLRTGQWTQMASLNTARASLGAAFHGGRIYAAGGFQSSGTAALDPINGVPGVNALNSVKVARDELEVYDPAADAWTPLAPMPTARHSLALVSAGSRLYAIGGADADGTPLDAVESYDPATNQWRAERPLPTARALFAAVNLSQAAPVILAIGGLGPDLRPTRAVDAFVPEAQP